jgi:hypothetical protein
LEILVDENEAAAEIVVVSGGGAADVATDQNAEAAEAEKMAEKRKNLIMYSVEELSELRKTTLSNEWPSYLDEAFKNTRGSWDPDRWHQNRKRGSTPPPDEKKERPQSSLSTEGKVSGIILLTLLWLLFFFLGSSL